MLDRLRRIISGPATVEPPPLDEITLRPIGVVRNSVKEPMSGGWENVKSRIVLRPELADALLGLDQYSHIQVLFWPHLIPEEVRGSKPRLHPMDDPANPTQGVLATRAQIRYNPILLSVVPLEKVDGNVLRVRGLDAVDGSPVLDIKPYIPPYDAVAEATVPEWILALRQRRDERA
ncbi:MAG: tRNA (N6-threonylcarbamoyladenosine(37)-N6)-methyltransferase TrmO [Dehalococcoidia bacterium]